MGAVGRGASLATIIGAVDHWKPQAIVMIGIAFGIDSKKQQIGDVLVSDSIIQYDRKRVGKDETIYRGRIPEAGMLLINRFKNSTDWHHNLVSGTQANTISGPMLSGEVLIDDADFRKKLTDEFPEAIGGEMEGCGLYAAAEEKKVEWIILKGICDYADGNKSKNKKEYQNIAAESAACFCEHVFKSEFAFLDLGITPYPNAPTVKHLVLSSKEVNKVLFDLYNLRLEDYYISRDADELVSRIILYNSLWISGFSGVGKTNTIVRNLLQNDSKFIYIDLARCVRESNDSLLHNLYLDLKGKLKIEGALEQFPTNSSSIIKSIVNLLEESTKSSELVLYLDEIPIDNGDIFADFISKIMAIHISLSNIPNCYGIKLLVSSINNPLDAMFGYQKKIHEKLKFYEMKKWTKDEIELLINKILQWLKLSIANDNIEKIIVSSNGSPRFVKKFFRNLISCNCGNCDFEMILNDTLREIG